MIVYVVLDAAALPLGSPGHVAGVSNARPVWLPAAVYLAWRVSRGGHISRGLLLLGTGASYLVAALGLARAWDVPIVILLLIYAAQLLLLVSTPVYRRTRQDRAAEPPGSHFRWPVPPAWVVLGGMAGGAVVTLLYLGSMNWQPMPGCEPPGVSMRQLPGQCIELAEGYPLRFLSADQNVPEINKAAMARDWVQWALVSSSVLYLVCWTDPGRRRRHDFLEAGRVRWTG